MATITEQQADKIILSLENLTKGLARGFVGQGNIVSKQRFQSEVQEKSSRGKFEVTQYDYDRHFKAYKDEYEKHMHEINKLEGERAAAALKGDKELARKKQEQLSQESKSLASVIQS